MDNPSTITYYTWRTAVEWPPYISTIRYKENYNHALNKLCDAWVVMPNSLICYNAPMIIHGQMHYFSTKDFTLSISKFIKMSVFLMAQNAFLYAFFFP